MIFFGNNLRILSLEKNMSHSNLKRQLFKLLLMLDKLQVLHKRNYLNAQELHKAILVN